jgi:nicotinamide phosphoribosyltransferase
MDRNLITLTDSYKFTHWKQYPPLTENVYSYFESRGGQFKDTVFFGLQYFLKQYLEGPVITRYKVEEAEQVVGKHLGNPALFNRAGWMRIVEKHGGRLPVVIRAVPEGTVVPVLTPLMTVENTDPELFWLTNYLETLLVQTWYPTTVATLSREMKRIILKALEDTGDPNLIGFKLHDFGFRGVSSVESAGIGGAAHLVNFMGTDTVEALMIAKAVYGADMAGFSIPAAEHSTITSWGKENEVKAFDNMLTQFPEGLVAVVSDSFDIFKACNQYWGQELREKVLSRNGTLVVRPDSGVPEEVVVKVLEALGEAFGYDHNAKGFKVLNPKVRVIQGDGIDYDSVQDILGNMRVHKWSADNIAFGMGGALLQKLNRDTQKFAFKCSSVVVNGQPRDVFKQPVTQDWKRSKAGRFDVGPEVFRDGKVLVEHKFDDIRVRAALATATEPVTAKT